MIRASKQCYAKCGYQLERRAIDPPAGEAYEASGPDTSSVSVWDQRGHPVCGKRGVIVNAFL